MRYLIDTYNLIHTAAGMGGPLGDMTVRKLCQYLAASASSLKATLVLDGRAKPDEPSENEFPDFTLLYSGTGVPADSVIAQIVERSTSRKNLVVVSNDREVASHARRLFAGVMSCETFLQQITQYNARAARDALPAKKTTGTPTTGEADHWMKEFGFDAMPKEPKKEKPSEANDELGGFNVEDLLGPKGS